jgi:plastocyanin
VAGSLSSALGATTNVVVVGAFPNYAYSPKVISVQVGDKVIWSGLGAIHSVTGDTAPEVLCGVSFPGNCTNVFNIPGTYLYHCVNHVSFGMTGVVSVVSVVLPPGVTITSPAGGSVFAEPASVKISASVTNTSGSVTNVQFFSNGGPLGSVTTAPFNFTTAPLSFGAYTLTATATASTGLSATSAPVNLSVVAPVAVSNFFPRITNGQFVFEHTANPGLRYAVENTTNFTGWSPVVTNTAVSNSVEVTDTFQVGNLRFYRVGRVPNP